MDFREARIAMSILERYQCGQNRDWGDEENRKLPIGGTFQFEHDKCWIALPRTTDDPDLADEERQQMEDAGWMFDEENGAWSHF
jgi:hypothetical protein